jgi:prepilin-type N-terminal cleavage/methylation domain-containing protein
MLRQEIAMARNNMQRGDTLVEVLMAVVILSIVIVGAITMMARGLNAAQTAVEHTQVRLSTSSQAEILRYLRDGYLQDPNSNPGQVWSSLFTGSPVYANGTASSSAGACAVTSGKTGFYLEQAGANITAQTFDAGNQPTTVATPGQGLWIEATRSAGGISPAYVDFQLRACWSGVGSSVPQQTVTVVRLYDPSH